MSFPFHSGLFRKMCNITDSSSHIFIHKYDIYDRNHQHGLGISLLKAASLCETAWIHGFWNPFKCQIVERDSVNWYCSISNDSIRAGQSFGNFILKHMINDSVPMLLQLLITFSCTDLIPHFTFHISHFGSNDSFLRHIWINIILSLSNQTMNQIFKYVRHPKCNDENTSEWKIL